MGGKNRSFANPPGTPSPRFAQRKSSRWRFWIDRGGTFTDCIGVDPNTGELHVVKVLSSDGAPVTAIRQVLGLPSEQSIPPSEVRIGTTIATNAVLERRGADVTLVVSKGFSDLLAIGDQTRPQLFALDIERPSPLFAEVLELRSRVDQSGKRIESPTAVELAALVEGITSRSVAISLIGANQCIDIEAEVAVRLPESSQVSTGGELRSIGYLSRTQTAVLDAYTTPLLSQHIKELANALGDSTLLGMQSWGGLTEARRLRGRNAILSGPAGGVVAAAQVARECGFNRAVGFDMGGTSTDVVCIDGVPELTFETRVGDVTIGSPSLPVHTIAAGGGSIICADGGRLSVGPTSAGAFPGPACYGNSADDDLLATVTDANMVLGRITDDQFPIALDKQASIRALQRIASKLSVGDVNSVAAAAIEIANHKMAGAIRELTVKRGRDPANHGLVVYGGAGGQHACAVANLLQIDNVVFDPLAGVLSAYGIGLAKISSVASHALCGVILGEASCTRALIGGQESARARATTELRDQGFSAEAIQTRTSIDLRYLGTDSSIGVAFTADLAALRRDFESNHKQRFGYVLGDGAIEAVAVRVEGSANDQKASRPQLARRNKGRPTPSRFGSMWTGAGFEQVAVFESPGLQAGDALTGPVLIVAPSGTTVLEPGWLAVVDDVGRLRATCANRDSRKPGVAASSPALVLEIFASLFMSIANQMGHALERTAISTNIRERHDFSCALFASDGSLVANAPHIPVHLGAMSETVKQLLRSELELRPGDVFATNDPSLGGSHLPDITVISGVFVSDESRDNSQPDFFVASRGHHADVGGITPGSMPAESTSLDEEGVVISMMRIVSGSHFEERELRELLSAGRWPCRDVETNLADLRAQIAANQTGSRELIRACREHGLERITQFMERVQTNAAERVRAAIGSRPDGVSSYSDTLDDGSVIAVTTTIRGTELAIDFGGTSGQHRGNLNAPRAVTMAAVLYTLRTLVGVEIPLNGGCLRPVTVRIEPRSLLDPAPGAAVASGNVEVSQRVVDVLFGALGLAAASQGTMNNLTFGSESFGYYETIGGGGGASANKPGASAVHTHMTNTRITDVEVLESRFPLRVHRFAIRHGSGGNGARRGGDGIVREIEALADLELSIVSERRVSRPSGLDGGGAGASGVNRIDGELVGGRVQAQLSTGQRVIVETPGGGGHGTNHPLG